MKKIKIFSIGIKMNEILSLFILFLIFPLNLYLTSSLKPSFNHISPMSDNFQSINDKCFLNYSMEYSLIDVDGKKYYDTFNFDLDINGINSILNNGTIDYYVEKNVTETVILDALLLLFPTEQISFFENHSINESFHTFFSYRKEALTNYTYAFVENSSYTPFWLMTDQNSVDYLKPMRSIPFFDVSSPIYLYINNIEPIITSTTWSDSWIELSKNVPLIQTYYLYYNYRDKFVLKLYFDQNNGILLHSIIQYEDSSSSSIKNLEIDLKLRSSSFDLNYLEQNVYYQRKILVLGIVSISTLLISVILLTNNKKRKDGRESKKLIKKDKQKNKKKDIIDLI